MKIYPAIDLIDGSCVRLEQGRFDSTKVYDNNPINIACSYAKAGATYLHVVDLDGAKAKTPQQGDLVIQIAKESGLKVQTGGGVRSLEQVQSLLAGGIDRVIVGSLAVKEPEVVRSFLRECGGENLTLAIDIRLDKNEIPMAATEGWVSGGDASLWDILDFYTQDDLQSILCTDIGRDGMLVGPNLELYQEILKRYPKLELQASGGVAELSDLSDVKEMGCSAVIIGKALYENRFTLNEALNVG